MFSVIEQLPSYSGFFADADYPQRLTTHGKERLRGRVMAFQKRGGHVGTMFDSAFVVDTGHENGHEIHAITNTACVFVFNKRSKKLVTVLFARPKQIERYYAEGRAPKSLINYALEYKVSGLNEL